MSRINPEIPMKIKFVSLLFMVTVGICSWVQAESTLTIGSTSAELGEIVSIPLSISGVTEDYAGINAKIYVPDCVTVTDVSHGSLLSGNNFNTSFLPFADQNGNGVSLITYSTTNSLSGNGTLLLVKMQVGALCQGQSYQLEFATTNPDPLINANHAVSNGDGSASLSHLVTNGSLTITGFTDTDNDGINDAWEIYNLPPGWSGDPLNAYSRNGDYDGDGYTDYQEYLNSVNNELDPNGDYFDPDFENEPNGIGYKKPGIAVAPILLLLLGN